MQSPTLLILVTSCLTVLVTAETQSSKFGASRDSRQQQQQHNAQQQQQAFSSRYLHLASDQQTAGGESSNNNAVPYHFTSSRTPGDDISSDALSSGVSSYLNSNSHIGEVLNSQAEDGQSERSNFIKNVHHTPIQSDFEHSHNNQLSKNINNPRDNSILPQDDVISRDIQHTDHRVDKREAASSPASDGHAESELADEDYPIYLDRRFQVFMPSSASFSSPYLSAQEFKETFRRSDPYFMGKRATVLLHDEDLRSPGERRLVGNIEAPYFVGKRESSLDLDSYLAKLEYEDDDSQLIGDKRGPPKFVGRRGAPYMVGKRGAPKFVGKRLSAFEVEDDALLSSVDKRGAPKFVGRREDPYFVNKRELSSFSGNRWNELTTEDELNWLLEQNNAASKFVGRRGAPYFVGKRASPMLIGKRAGLFALDHNDESSLLNDRSEMASFITTRGSPYFVGKRGAPKFVGKRWANPEHQSQALAILEDKRGAPKFVGRRGSPYFVGKREPVNFDENEVSSTDDYRQFLGDKRRAPKFVGRRGAPMFIGKRGPPMFIGKRISDFELTDAIINQSEDKRAAPKFVGRRGAPKFVGKRGPPKFVGRRGAPKFVGKRDFDLLDRNTNQVLFGKEAGDFGQGANEFVRSLLEDRSLSEDKSFLTGGKIETGPNQEESENSIPIRAIENARIQDRNVQHAAVERTSDDRFQNAVAEETEELR